MKKIVLILLLFIGVSAHAETNFKHEISLANQGNANAQSNLGEMYLFGKGVNKNYKKAFEWFSKAAKQGHISAQYNLGLLYSKGLGVHENPMKGFLLISVAADSGYEPAIKLREKAIRGQSPAQRQLIR